MTRSSLAPGSTPIIFWLNCRIGSLSRLCSRQKKASSSWNTHWEPSLYPKTRRTTASTRRFTIGTKAFLYSGATGKCTSINRISSRPRSICPSRFHRTLADISSGMAASQWPPSVFLYRTSFIPVTRSLSRWFATIEPARAEYETSSLSFIEPSGTKIASQDRWKPLRKSSVQSKKMDAQQVSWCKETFTSLSHTL